VEYTDKSDLERVSQHEVSRRSRLSENTPPTIEPLVCDLEYNGITEVGREILSGTYEAPPGLDDNTFQILQQLRLVQGVNYVPTRAPWLTKETY